MLTCSIPGTIDLVVLQTDLEPVPPRVVEVSIEEVSAPINKLGDAAQIVVRILGLGTSVVPAYHCHSAHGCQGPRA